jgi:hypothetical protein
VFLILMCLCREPKLQVHAPPSLKSTESIQTAQNKPSSPHSADMDFANENNDCNEEDALSFASDNIAEFDSVSEASQELSVVPKHPNAAVVSLVSTPPSPASLGVYSDAQDALQLPNDYDTLPQPCIFPKEVIKTSNPPSDNINDESNHINQLSQNKPLLEEHPVITPLLDNMHTSPLSKVGEARNISAPCIDVQDIDSDSDDMVDVPLHYDASFVPTHQSPQSHYGADQVDADINLNAEDPERTDDALNEFQHSVISDDEIDYRQNNPSAINDSDQENAIRLQQSQVDLQAENASLRDEASRAARVSAEITPEMVADVQYLLQLLGIPYVVSPSEAEAQCAMLERLHLTNGSITDDNDVFLFGGSIVFRNVCSKRKGVERYTSEDIQKNLCWNDLL